MPQLQPDTALTTPRLRYVEPASAVSVSSPMFGVIDAVLVDDSATFLFDGAVTHGEAQAVWTWLRRDVASDLIGPLANAQASATALEAALPALLSRARAAIAAAASSAESERRLRMQLGGSEVLPRLPGILNALKSFPLLKRAAAFGRAVNSIEDDGALVAALQSMPRRDADIAALLMMAAVGQVATPGRLVMPAVRIAGSGAEADIARAGFGPLLDALLAHAQNTIPLLQQRGPFADIDRACRAVERFHRLMRAINDHVELTRPGHRASIVAALTKTVSDRLEPRLDEVLLDINQALRRTRDGADRLDSDRLLAALNGAYLLATVRDCRDSLALNQVFDETWNRSGQALELHLARLMEALRATPGDPIVAQRLDAGIKMAEIRFGGAYADILRHARGGIERRLPNENAGPAGPAT